MPLKQKVMFISQTSLQTSKTCTYVTGCAKIILPFSAWDHIVGTSKLFRYIYRLDIYIVSTYVHTRTLHDCSLAQSAVELARSLI